MRWNLLWMKKHISDTSQENDFLSRDLWLSLLWIITGNISETLFLKDVWLKWHQFKISDGKTQFRLLENFELIFAQTTLKTNDLCLVLGTLWKCIIIWQQCFSELYLFSFIVYWWNEALPRNLSVTILRLKKGILIWMHYQSKVWAC